MTTRVTRGSGTTDALPHAAYQENISSISSTPTKKIAGRKATAQKESTQPATASDALPNSDPKMLVSKRRNDSKLKVQGKEHKSSANVGKKRKRGTPLDTSSARGGIHDEELPQNMGRIDKGIAKRVETTYESRLKPSPKKRAMQKTPVKLEKDEDQKNGPITTKAKSPVSIAATPRKKLPKAVIATHTSGKKPELTSKKDKYGVSEGISPFPNYLHPTPDECYKVAKLLRKAHPNCRPRPKTIPEPSQIVAGCGEVPSILDALIRTLLSAATNGRNSSNAYQGMVKRYGNRETGVGKGSVDYNAVRLAPQAALEKAIASGGLAKNKSKNIKAILDMVYEENQHRRKELLAARAVGRCESGPVGSITESNAQQDAEIALAEDTVLSLDHLYYLPTYAAISHFTKYPGIGVKTAACVSLFCMQRDCFAVDTHVFRLCKWLGWVPDQSATDYVKAKGEPRVDRDPTFSHLEVRIPDELKYELHQLFIQHGKRCGRCRGNTSETHPDWAKGCPIEELVNRSGPRKGGSPLKKAGKSGGKSSKKIKRAFSQEDDSDDDNDIEMSDLVEDEDNEEVEDAMPDLDDEEEFKIPRKSIAETPASSTKRNFRGTREALDTPSKATSTKQKLRKDS